MASATESEIAGARRGAADAAPARRWLRVGLMLALCIGLLLLPSRSAARLPP